ncbi:hypothetical protein GH810_05255 [Acetobacterium paludosum]|uniref:Uncharacterized protein n=1 Tax=Acetobacterium paludosum TaxID=52693 RepID=A0A923HV33_9FIRM|nr:hypothetical protein [Acetobacterium paludosum]MBC3887712.1 hypothetical protein [Acetobacterium paludosum]
MSSEKIGCKEVNINFPDEQTDLLTQFVGVFLDLQEKAMNSEISTKSVDLRGIIASLKMIRRGLKSVNAISMGIIGKLSASMKKKF